MKVKGTTTITAKKASVMLFMIAVMFGRSVKAQVGGTMTVSETALFHIDLDRVSLAGFSCLFWRSTPCAVFCLIVSSS